MKILKIALLALLLSGVSFAQAHINQPATGGTGIANTATFKMGSANWDLSAFSGGIPAISGGGVGAIAPATAHNLGVPLICADISGSGTAQSCATTPSFTPAAGDCINYTTTTANSGTGLTLNVNSTSAYSVAKSQTTTTLAANDIRANTQIKACLDAANHWEIDTVGNAGSGGIGTITLPSTQFTNSPCTGPTCNFDLQNQNPGYFLRIPDTGAQTPQLVQEATPCHIASGTSFPCSFGQPTAAGNLVEVWFAFNAVTGTPAVTDNKSQSYTALGPYNGSLYVAPYYFANTVAGVTTVTLSGLAIAVEGDVMMREWSGAKTTSPSDGVATGATATCTANLATMPSLTTTNANDLIINYADTSWGDTALVGPGFIFLATGASMDSYVAKIPYAQYRTVNSPGAYAPVMGCTGTLRDIYTVAFKGATTAPSTQPGYGALTFPQLWFAFPNLVNVVGGPSSSPGAMGLEIQAGQQLNATKTGTAYSATTVYTAPSGLPEAMHCWVSVTCDGAPGGSTIIPSLSWTDESNTSETYTGSTATCGTTNFSGFTVAPRIKAGTAITYTTALASSPTWDNHVSCSVGADQ